jgi:PAS domain-containing protein
MHRSIWIDVDMFLHLSSGIVDISTRTITAYSSIFYTQVTQSMNPVFDRELLNFAISSIPFGLAIWNPKSQFLHWSDTQAELHGLHLMQFDGSLSAFLNLIHPLDVEFMREFLTQSEAHEPDLPLRPYRILEDDGRIRWLQMHAHSIDHGCLLLTTQEVTDERNLGSVLIQINLQKRFWLAHTQDVVFILNGNRFILECSQSALMLFTRDRSELIGRSILDLIHLDDRPIVAHLLQETEQQTDPLIDIRLLLGEGWSKWADLWWHGAQQGGGCLILQPQQQTLAGPRSRRARARRARRS